MKQKLKQFAKHPLGMIICAAVATALATLVVVIIISLFILLVGDGSVSFFAKVRQLYVVFCEFAILVLTVPGLIATFIDQHYNGLPKGEFTSDNSLLVKVSAIWIAPLIFFTRVDKGSPFGVILWHTVLFALVVGLFVRGNYYSKYKRIADERAQRINELADRLSKYEDVYK